MAEFIDPKFPDSFFIRYENGEVDGLFYRYQFDQLADGSGGWLSEGFGGSPVWIYCKQVDGDKRLIRVNDEYQWVTFELGTQEDKDWDYDPALDR